MAAAATTTHITPPDPPAGIARWTPSLPTNLMSMLNPFANGETTPNASDGSKKATAMLESQSRSEPDLKRPILSAMQLDKASTSTPPSPSRSSNSVMFAEPETRSNSDDGSRDGSIDGARRLKKSSKPKTRFSICHPPPESKVKQKFHRRPRSLLQLHSLSSTARPLPAFEVIPSANFSVRLTRAITKVFKAKHGLCANDLVVLKAEKYSHEEDDEEKEARDVIGLICRGRKEDEKTASGKMLIHMASGTQWEAYTTASGVYECTTTDEHGLSLTVRWVPKKGKDGSKVVGKDGSRRFNFSTISPNSRRHPVIASLSKTGLDVNDRYRMPDATATTPLSTPKAASTILEDAMNDEIGGQDLCHTDDQLREIITITGIWVAFKEGWSPSFKYDEKRDSEPTIPGSPARSASGIASPPGSPATFAPLEKRSSIKSFGSGVFRRASVMSRSNRNSTMTMFEDGDSPAPSRNNSVNLGTTRSGRARADSSSTVLVHRAASNRRKNHQTSSFRPDHIISNDLHETSKEDLARDFKASTLAPEVKKERSPLSRQASESPESSSSGDEDDLPITLSKAPSRSMTMEKPKHIESNVTMETRSSIAATRRQGEPHPIPIVKAQKKKVRSWRKLLCGASSID